MTPRLLYVLLNRAEIEQLVAMYRCDSSLMGDLVERAAAVMTEYDDLEMGARDTTKYTAFGVYERESVQIVNDLRPNSGTAAQQQLNKKMWRALLRFRKIAPDYPFPDAGVDVIDRRFHKDLLKDWVYAPE